MEVTVGREALKIKLIKKKRKTISIKIDEKGEIIVSAPLHISNSKLEELIKSKEAWILSKIHLVKQKKQEKSIFEIGVNYLGVNYSINTFEVQGNMVKLNFDKSHFNVYIPHALETKEEALKDILIKWYKAEARRILEQRVKLYGERLGVYPERIFIKNQKTKWGSCSSRRNINLNYRIIMAPMEVVDYLVVHELCHLVHLNHSKDFWSLVEKILPHYKKHQNWLKLNGSSLSL